MKVIDAIARILKIEGAEFLSAYPTTPLIEAAAKVEIRRCCAARNGSAWGSPTDMRE